MGNKCLSESQMQSGAFVVGCNYWASHAGMMMWRDWRAEVVAEDLKQLAAEGLQVLRVFPLWPDFQPLQQIYGGHATRRELRVNEKLLGPEPVVSAGVSEEAMERFRFLADTAQNEGLQLIVGLVTGWMSGRLFVPPAFEGMNALTDPLVLKWQARFVSYFVKTFKDHPAILSWDLGNECNCMGKIEFSEQAWVWTSMIAGAIRQADPDKPVVSGMHSLSPTTKGVWRITDQGELTDILTTHPYPIFTPYCNQDPVNRLRNGFHATAQSRMYSDLSGRPCFAEEMGTLGPMVCSEKVAAEFTRSALYTLWAHDCRAMLWWCAYDQMHLDFAPYDTNDHERELGLIRTDRQVKPVLKTVADFRKKIESLPFSNLPVCKREAVCILTDGQDAWAAAFSSYILAKQAGFDIRFQHASAPLIDADLYLMPSIDANGDTDPKLRNGLLEKAEQGATVYISVGGVYFEPFSKFFGIDILHREKSMINSRIKFNTLEGKPVLTGNNEFRLVTEPLTAEVLAAENDGNIAFSCNKVGKGKIYYLSFPLEMMLSATPGAFHGEKAQPYYRIYEEIGREIIDKRLVVIEHPNVTVTEHTLTENEEVAVVINHAPEMAEITLKLAEGWCVKKNLFEGESCVKQSLPGNDAIVLLLGKE